VDLAIRATTKLRCAAEVKIQVAWFSDGPATLILIEIDQALSTLGTLVRCLGHASLPTLTSHVEMESD
jgi:hypothetical protein